MEPITIAICIWTAAVIGGAYVAAQKHRSILEGLIFGLVFGPLGMLTVACLPELAADRPSALSRWL